MDPDSTAPEEMVVLAVVEDIRWEPVPVRPVETTVERVRRTALHTTEAVAEVLAEDVRVWQRSARTSFAHFQRLLLALSVDRPPRSVALFSPADAARACDHVLQVYFSNFKLFKACCSTVPSPALSQRSTAAVEEPYAPLPLSHAVMLAERPAAASEVDER